MNFDRLVQSIYLTAIMQLGGATPEGEQPRVDILGARQSIDMLAVLADKTKGNLTDAEDQAARQRPLRAPHGLPRDHPGARPVRSRKGRRRSGPARRPGIVR